MSAFYNDGGIPYGSRIITISNVAFVAEDFNVTKPSFAIDRKNQLNEPSGSVSVPEFITGTATLQLANTNSVAPLNGDTFYSNVGTTNTQFYITEVGLPEARDQEKKVPITFKKTYN